MVANWLIVRSLAAFFFLLPFLSIRFHLWSKRLNLSNLLGNVSLFNSVHSGLRHRTVGILLPVHLSID